MTKTNVGQDIQSFQMGGDVVGLAGVSTTAPAATTYTLDGKTTTLNQYAGHIIVAGSTAVGCVYGIIQTTTAATPGVVTVDHWYNPATPNATNATTPVAGPWCILIGAHPACFVACSASATVGVGATTLSGEITTASGGLLRQRAPYAHTPSAASYTLTPVFTVLAADSIPVTILKIGVFNSAVVGATVSNLLFETALSPATATLSALNDSVTVTETVSL